MDSVLVPLGVVAAAFGVGELPFLGRTQGVAIWWRENVLSAHLFAPGFGRALFLEKRLERADAGMEQVGLFA